MSNYTHQAQRSYVIGFAASIVLTVSAYLMVVHKVLGGWALGSAIVGLAMIQLTVQLVCFLHLGRETKPRWKLLVFWFMLLILVIVVFGSLWIMSNLAYHHNHTPVSKEVNTYLHNQDAL